VCGSDYCPSFGISSEVGGVFAEDDRVTGTVEVAARIGPGCCYGTIAFDATLFVEEVFADGFECGSCEEWSREVW
jgi:hypothetical protein